MTNQERREALSKKKQYHLNKINEIDKEWRKLALDTRREPKQVDPERPDLAGMKEEVTEGLGGLAD